MELTIEQRRAMALASARLRAKQSSPEAKYDPTEGMSGFEKFAAGAGKALSDTSLGIQQLGAYIGLGDSEALAKEAADRKQRDRALMDTGAGFSGNLAGNLGLALAPGGALKAAGTVAKAPALSAAGGVLLAPQKVRHAATIGAAYGASQPAEDVGERLLQTGIGAGATAAFPVMGMAHRSAKSIVEPLYEEGQKKILGRLLRTSAGDYADDAMRALQQSRELVPGSLPTVGQASGSAGIAALERAAAQANPEEYARRFAAQNTARVEALEGMTGIGGQRAFFDAERRSTADELYKQAYQKGVDITRDASTGAFLSKAQIAARKGEITKLLQRPAIQDAVKEARTLARNEGIKINDPTGSVQGLDYVKRALDDKIAKATGNEQRILVNLKDRLLTTLDTLSPDYAAARNVFRDMSRPINQMDIVQEIANKSINKLTGNVQPNAFARALSDDTAVKATGFNRATLESIMDPQQLQVLGNIKDDLAASVFAQNAGRGVGSNTFQNLAQQNLMNSIGVGQLPNLLSRPIQVANYGLRTIYGSANKDMQQMLAQGLLNPQTAAEMMAMATPSQRQALVSAMARHTFAPLGMATPGLLNANQ